MLTLRRGVCRRIFEVYSACITYYMILLPRQQRQACFKLAYKRTNTVDSMQQQRLRHNYRSTLYVTRRNNSTHHFVEAVTQSLGTIELKEMSMHPSARFRIWQETRNKRSRNPQIKEFEVQKGCSEKYDSSEIYSEVKRNITPKAVSSILFVPEETFERQKAESSVPGEKEKVKKPAEFTFNFYHRNRKRRTNNSKFV